MPTKRVVTLWSLAALTVVLTVILTLADEGEAARIVVDEDWVVDTSIPDPLSDNEYVMRANLTITSTGSIAFRRCRLTFMADTPGRFGIAIEAGGYMLAHTSTLQRGLLAPGQEAEAWTFVVKESGRLYLERCDIDGVGVTAAADSDRGLAIQSDNVRISNTTFKGCERGLVIMNGANPTITDNTFQDNTAGIEVTGSPFSLDTPNEFRENNFGIIFNRCGQGFLGAGTFIDNMYAVQASTSTVRVEDVAMEGMGESIFSGSLSRVVAVDCYIYTMYGKGKAMFQSTILMVDCNVTNLAAFTETDGTSSVKVNVTVQFLVEYAGAAYPIEGAEVQLYDGQEDMVFKDVTDDRGLTPQRQVTVYEHRNDQQPRVLQPFKAEVSMGYNYAEKLDITLLPHHLVEVGFVDDEPPELTVSSPANGSVFNHTDLVLAGTAMDVHSGLTGLQYHVDGGEGTDLPVQAQWEQTVQLWEGELTLVVVARDLLGNEAEVTIQVVIDTTPPEVLDIHPPAGSVTRAYQLLVVGTTEPGVTLSRDGEDMEVAENGSFMGYVTLSDDDGEQSVTFLLTDQAGNARTFVYSVVVDRTPPDLDAETSPDYRDFSIVNRSRVLVFGNAEPWARVEVTINDELVNSTVADELGRWSLEVDLRLGENDLLIDAFDEAGNRESVEVIRFLYDTEPPEIAIILPMDGSTSDVETILVRARTEYGASLWVNNGTEKVQPSHGEVDFENVLLDEGNNTIRVYARDKAGNVALEVVHVFYEPNEDGGGGDAGFPIWIVVAAVVLGLVAAVVIVRSMRSVG